MVFWKAKSEIKLYESGTFFVVDFLSTLFNTASSAAPQILCVGGCWNWPRAVSTPNALTIRLDLLYNRPFVQNIGCFKVKHEWEIQNKKGPVICTKDQERRSKHFAAHIALIFATPQWATPHPSELRHTPLSYSTPHLPCHTLLSYSTSYLAMPHPSLITPETADLRHIPVSY